MTVQPKYPQWQLGFSTLGCPQYSLWQAAALARQFGISAMELRALGGELNLPQYFRSIVGGDVNSIPVLLHNYQVNIVALDSSWRILDSTAQGQEDIMELSRWAQILHVPYLRAFDGGEAGRLTVDDLHRLKSTLDWWRELRLKHGWEVDLLVETHWALTSIQNCRRLIQSDSHVGLLWDAHHTWRISNEPPISFWKSLGPQVKHIHIKDSVRDPAAPGGYRYVLPGTGDFPLLELLHVLREDGFAGPLSLEWERYWFPELPDLPTALEHLTTVIHRLGVLQLREPVPQEARKIHA